MNLNDPSLPCVDVYPDDLENESGLSHVSDGAWKLWVRIFLFTGSKSPKRGYLLKVNGAVPTVAEIAAQFSLSAKRTETLLTELEDENVF
ncbi:MAG: hypothetical protein EPN91_06820, partial [Salinibacterium sp.]